MQEVVGSIPTRDTRRLATPGEEFQSWVGLREPISGYGVVVVIRLSKVIVSVAQWPRGVESHLCHSSKGCAWTQVSSRTCKYHFGGRTNASAQSFTGFRGPCRMVSVARYMTEL